MSGNNIVIGIAILLAIAVAGMAISLKSETEAQRPRPILVSFEDAMSQGGGLTSISDEKVGTHPRATLIHPVAADDAALAGAIGSSVLALQRYWGTKVIVSASQETVVRGRSCRVIIICPAEAVTQ